MSSLLPVLPVIVLAFDPVAQLGEWLIRIQTLALAGVLFVSLLAAALIARRTPVDVDHAPDDTLDDADGPNHLRRDDLLFIVVAAIPGAVLGGRIGYALIHLDYYRANPGGLVDIGQGGFELSLAIVGGTITALVVATLLGAPSRRWMHALILPVLLAIAGGKLTMMLGGEGQGVPFDGPWATAYAGPGPWLSLAPAIPSHPSQAYEGVATFVVMAIVIGLLATGRFRRRSGGLFLFGLALWAIARFLVAFTWRDPLDAGALSADQVLALAIAAGSLALLGVVTAADRRGASGAGAASSGGSRGATDGAGGTKASRGPAAPGAEPDWPDPTTRPRI